MNEEYLIRWRMILGGGPADGTGVNIDGDSLRMDQALSALYDSDRKGGLGDSNPNVSRWLGDIRTYFPNTVVQIMQKDALDRLQLTSMLMEPEMLEHVSPDVHLVASLLSLSKVIPEKTKDTARDLVRKVVDDLMKKLTAPMYQAIGGSINRHIRNKRPRHNEINWHATIQKNLKHYQPDYNSIIPETRIGYGRNRRNSLKEIVLCVDQSGSMATSLVYSGIFGAVMASIPAIKTRMIVFDTSVVDLTEDLDDPVELLFGVQLGGGTDIARVLKYCQQQVTKPNDTILVLITDLYEGGNEVQMRSRILELQRAGIQFIVLLALNDSGKPFYDTRNAAFLAEQGIPTFACTPNLFPDLMACAINKQDISMWAAKSEITLVGKSG